GCCPGRSCCNVGCGHMDVVEDSAKREALAQRMSKLLGLPITNIQLLMPLISKDDLEQLEALPDDQFLSQATKIINAAQKRQFDEQDSAVSESAADAPVVPDPSTAPPPPAETAPVEKKRKISIGRKKEEAESDDAG